MTELPIDSSLPRIIEELAGRALVLVAPPGSGKTTRVPTAIVQSGLLPADHPAVIVLQPRRVAAAPPRRGSPRNRVGFSAARSVTRSDSRDG